MERTAIRNGQTIGNYSKAAQVGDKVIAPYLYEWSTTAVWFETWFEWHLCPQLKTGRIIIMDNAKLHRKTVLNSIAKFYGPHILWLPPYSPNKNDIEHLWANMKKYIRKHSGSFTSLQDVIMSYFNLN